jgi:glycosyltransferase involved in cell wall biosynthesis
MKISVLIPAYNSARFLRATLDSVLRQSHPPHEILVMDDGSTDETPSILEEYRAWGVSSFRQANRGCAASRNALVQRATGELIAMLDHDDIWGPDYLACHVKLANEYPQAVGQFVRHRVFTDPSHVRFDTDDKSTELIPAERFLRRYHSAIGPFMSQSFFAFPRRTAARLGFAPFRTDVGFADDVYLFNLLPTMGPISLSHECHGAYRHVATAQSVNRLKCGGHGQKCLMLLRDIYEKDVNRDLLPNLKWASGVLRRENARLHMGVGDPELARHHLRRAIGEDPSLWSRLKTSRVYLQTFLPKPLQPRWPSARR